MTPPLISAVIPSYNHRGFIGEAIASVRSQTYQPVEIVVIDDGSTDGSFEYIEREFGGSLAHLSRRDNRTHGPDEFTTTGDVASLARAMLAFLADTAIPEGGPA